MLRLERVEGSVRGHSGEGGVHEGEQVVLALAQEDADLAPGEGTVEERRREARIVPDVPPTPPAGTKAEFCADFSVLIESVAMVCLRLLSAAHRRRHTVLAAATVLLAGVTALWIAASGRSSSQTAARNRAPGFYVWQREFSPAVLAAARAAAGEGRELFVLAGEFDRRDGAFRDLAPGLRPPFDFGAGDASLPSATAVFRVRLGALDAPVPSGEALAERARELGATRLQLDVDAPERRLGDYAGLVRAVRAGLPAGAALSATLLPCHFAHPEDVRAVLEPADYGVLQLHGIDPPGALSDAWRLMDPATVRTALRRARALGAPLRVSLPAYAYVLTFAPDGAFRRLYAEGFPGRESLPAGTVCRLAAPDPALLAELLADPALPPAIWFRLPVPGADRWCLDRSTLSELEAGRVPAPCVALDAEPLPAGNGFRLFATFRHAIPLDPAEVPLRWRDEARAGEWMSLGGCAAAAPAGRLPESVTLAPHACGERFLAAVVLTDNGLSPDPQTHPLPEP